MTETQAGTAAANKVHGSAEAAAAAGQPNGGEFVGADGAAGNGADNAVGRATVPGGDGPKFTRPPGMAPPPDSLTVPVQAPISGPPAGATPSSGAGVGSVPSVSPAIARASVRMPSSSSGSATSTIGVRPSGSTGTVSGGPGVVSGGASGSAKVTDAVRSARKTVSAAVGRGPRRARLHVKRVDPWSVMKFSFAVSFVMFVVLIVATAVLYLALDAMGVFQSVNKTLADLIGATGGSDANTFKITAKGVIGGSALLGLVNVVLFTALATLGAFIYNVCADLVGGIELTLAEKD